MSKYPGPAGIFSTGDSYQDSLQILAEQGPLEDDLFEEEPIDEDYVSAHCTRCRFWKEEIYFAGDAEDLKKAKEKLRQRHQAEFPRCQGTLQFG
jgi:hypothetical protein